MATAGRKVPSLRPAGTPRLPDYDSFFVRAYGMLEEPSKAGTMHNHDRRRGSGTRPRCRVLDIHGGATVSDRNGRKPFTLASTSWCIVGRGGQLPRPRQEFLRKSTVAWLQPALWGAKSTSNARRLLHRGLRGTVRHQLLRVSSILPEHLGRSPVGPVNHLGRNVGFATRDRLHGKCALPPAFSYGSAAFVS